MSQCQLSGCEREARWEVGGPFHNYLTLCERHADQAFESATPAMRFSKVRWPHQPPYPFCRGNPSIADCARVGYCRRDPACDD